VSETLILADGYGGIVSERVSAERLALAAAWLTRLKQLLAVDVNDVFPTDQLLDHIPTLIAEIAVYLRAPADEEIAANAGVIDKARELGVLRNQQRASVHQVLREHEILTEILEAFVVGETDRLGLQPSAVECFELQRRLTRATRTLMRTTVETFISEYAATIHEQNERLKTFNRMASHELRSPVGTLLFAAAVLGSDAVRSDPQRLDKVAATVRANAERLSWLIANLQRLAQLGEPLDVPSVQRVDVGTVAGEVARQLADMAASRSVAIHVDPSLPDVVVDPARLELVLLNLVANAIKYSDPLKERCVVEITACSTAEDATCCVCVRDNGIGIPEDDREAIFARFFRAHRHLDGTLGVTGTGLGLAIVAECVEALGGFIRCESVTGEGSSFFLTLPREPPGAGAAS
jgi:signal transduction histidine kinase